MFRKESQTLKCVYMYGIFKAENSVLYQSVSLDIILKLISYRKYISIYVFDEPYPVPLWEKSGKAQTLSLCFYMYFLRLLFCKRLPFSPKVCGSEELSDLNIYIKDYSFSGG